MANSLFSAQHDVQNVLLHRAEQIAANASNMPDGVERNRLLKLARVIGTQANIYLWATSPGLRSPK